jgi:hypothetical protein
MTMAKPEKQVLIIATYYHKTDGKLNGIVTYLVRASNGVDTYCTTLINGQASGCTCPSQSKRGCYHKKQLEAREMQRRMIATQLAAKRVPTWVMHLVASGKLVVPAKAKAVESTTIQPTEWVKAVSTELGTRGHTVPSRQKALAS